MKKPVFVFTVVILIFANVLGVYGDDTLCSITGILIDEKSSKPMDGVSLALWGYGGIKDGQISMKAIAIKGKLPYRVSSDENGKFLFDEIPEGTYVIVQEIQFISQISNFIETKQGSQSTPAIKVIKGQALDLGTIKVRIKE